MYNSGSHFTREQYTFHQILPAFEKFQSKHVTDAAKMFTNYPKIFSASSQLEDEYVILEDLSAAGYTNVDRPSALGFDKCVLVLETLARFHAISFAFKDQHFDEFTKLTEHLSEIIFVEPVNDGFISFLKDNIGYSLTTLDKEKDAEVICKIQEFGEVYAKSMVECCREKEDAVILHGDCWISNMMFKQNVNFFKKFMGLYF